ncbi:hypothetical protein L6164_007259 [Bauhinia variegata]|uniref:Uncharacterized protein n=1 Tax=Bauhinia variegata TaxID=167791 RepID=A0ACB9PD21_BAUVA|nr:hypothetical protein L6164_007259 [Bauhinia variegata]
MAKLIAVIADGYKSAQILQNIIFTSTNHKLKQALTQPHPKKEGSINKKLKLTTLPHKPDQKAESYCFSVKQQHATENHSQYLVQHHSHQLLLCNEIQFEHNPTRPDVLYENFTRKQA